MKLLIDLFGWVPVLGDSLKLSYVVKCAYEASKNLQLPADKVSSNAEELEKHISEFSEKTYDELILPIVDKVDLPEFVKDKARTKSIEIFSTKLKEKYINKVSA